MEPFGRVGHLGDGANIVELYEDMFAILSSHDIIGTVTIFDFGHREALHKRAVLGAVFISSGVERNRPEASSEAQSESPISSIILIAGFMSMSSITVSTSMASWFPSSWMVRNDLVP